MIPNRFFGSLPNSSQQENNPLHNSLSVDAKLDLILSGLAQHETTMKNLQFQNDAAIASNESMKRYILIELVYFLYLSCCITALNFNFRSIDDMKKSVDGLSSRVKSLEENTSSSNTEGKACIKCPKELSVRIFKI